jgi:hypothetical protein
VLKELSSSGLGSLGAKASSSKALPPIGGNSSLESQVDAFAERKRLAEEAFQKNQEILSKQKQQDEEARQRLLQAVKATEHGSSAAVAVEEDDRARYMREQRDRLIAMKKKEREEKVKQEEERNKKKGADVKPLSPGKDPSASRFVELQRKAGADDTENAARREEEEAERKRAQLRRAMALHIKRDIVESEDAKYQQEETSHFAHLDRKLNQIEKLQQENSQRDAILIEQISKVSAKKTR